MVEFKLKRFFRLGGKKKGEGKGGLFKKRKSKASEDQKQLVLTDIQELDRQAARRQHRLMHHQHKGHASGTNPSSKANTLTLLDQPRGGTNPHRTHPSGHQQRKTGGTGGAGYVSLPHASSGARARGHLHPHHLSHTPRQESAYSSGLHVGSPDAAMHSLSPSHQRLQKSGGSQHFQFPPPALGKSATTGRMPAGKDLALVNGFPNNQASGAEGNQASPRTRTDRHQHQPRSGRDTADGRPVSGQLGRDGGQDRSSPNADSAVTIVTLKPEYLKNFSCQPLTLAEKLQRWDSVTDFDNPVPPPDTAAQLTQLMRRDSVYSGASLMDWQTYAIKQRRRKTQV